MRPLYLLCLALCALAVACIGDDFGDPLPDNTGTEEEDAGESVEEDVEEGSGEVEQGWGAGLPEVTDTPCGELQELESAYELAHCPYAIDHPGNMTNIYATCDTGEASSLPNQIHLTFPHRDASANVAVSWKTGTDNRFSVVRVAESPDALETDAARYFQGHTLQFFGFTDRFMHEVHMCGLPAATTLYYQVGGGGIWSDTFSFTTAPEWGDAETEFVFAATGDTRSDTFELWAQAAEQIRDSGAQMLLFSGDAVDAGPVQAQWDGFYAAGEAALANVPFVPANGNHDLLIDTYFGQLALPEGEDIYHVRFGNTLVISMTDTTLEPGALRGRYADYLEATLAEHQDATWKFLVNHRPFYSASTRHGSAEDLQDQWMPILDEYEVDVVFNGHDHNYERTVPIRNGERVELGRGTIYVVAAGVGAPMYDNGNQWWTEISEKIPSWCLVRVNGDRLEYTAYRLDGTEIDSFVWDKS